MSITLSFYAIILQMYNYLIIPTNTFLPQIKMLDVGCTMLNVEFTMLDDIVYLRSEFRHSTSDI